MTDVMSVQVLGAEWFSTHYGSAADVLAGRERAFTPPAFALLVGRARRFTSLVTQMHLEVCGHVKAKGSALPVAVFATCHGEIQTAETLLMDIRDNAMVSSARFALSVHNTPSGLYSVATGSAAATTTITGGNALAAGWLEAALTAIAENQTVLLSIADEPVPAAFVGPREPAGVAAAFLLSPAASAGRRAELAVVPCDDDDASDVDTLQTLARALEGAVRSELSTVDLGRLRPGARLELRLPAQDARS
jgi:hypothetical protein